MGDKSSHNFPLLFAFEGHEGQAIKIYIVVFQQWNSGPSIPLIQDIFDGVVNTAVGISIVYQVL